MLSKGACSIVALTAAAGVLSVSWEARGAEEAVYCSATELTCETADIAFHKEIVLPAQGGFDTGWVPANSPLQVHLFAQLYANSYVDLAGRLETNWPDALTLSTPPTPGGGHLGIHYGVDIGAEAHVEIEVLGQTFQWTGAIPYLPQFDFQVDADSPFDPWAFEGVTVDGSTNQETLVQVSVESFLPLNIPGLDGGFELDTYIELAATYKTHRIDVMHTEDGTLVEGGSITQGQSETFDPYLGGPSEDFSVKPSGEIVYDGVLHLVPAFYIDTIGPDFQIPIADIPIPFQFVQKDWEFDAVDVHVPLPDISVGKEGTTTEDVLVLDLGEVALGATAAGDVGFSNMGEARLVGSGGIDDPSFTLDSVSFDLDPASAATVGVTFTATEAGDFVASLVLASNDPDEPARLVELRAQVPEPIVPGGDDDGGSDDDSDYTAQGGGCSCGTAPTRTADLAWLAALAVVAVGSRRRRQQPA